MVENKNNIKSKLETSGWVLHNCFQIQDRGFISVRIISGLICIERWSYGKFPMPIIGLVKCLWWYFNCKGKDAYSVPDPWNNWLLKIKKSALINGNLTQGCPDLCTLYFKEGKVIYVQYIIHSQRKLVSLKVGSFLIFFFKLRH